MSAIANLMSMILKLPPATTSKLEYQLDLKIPMPDGVVLLANRIAPVGGESLPIILMRDPYASRGSKPDVMSELVARRGYQVIYQNCRGRFGSGGEFQPFRNEREDGLATLKWISEQPWFSGSVGMFGLSYWGYAQLAAGAGAPDYLKALVPSMAASTMYNVFRAHGTFSFFCLLNWSYDTFLSYLQESAKDKRKVKAQSKDALQRGFSRLPVGEADMTTLGFTLPFFQEVIRNDKPTDELWAAIDKSKLVKDIQAPVHFVAGWYDFCLGDELADYEALQSAGKRPYLTISDSTHAGMAGMRADFKESFAWYDAYLKGNRAALRSSPVSVYVMGIKKWVDLPSWPPQSIKTAWYLQAGGGLSPKTPVSEQSPSRFRYDPADPTPNVGGAIIKGGGPKDNRKLEARKDVLTFTSEPMKENLTIIGPVSAELYVKSTNEHTDFFARLCDVAPNGKSINICDGIVRLTPGSTRADKDGVHQVTINLLSTAHCFKPGHRVRLQVSSGAHPMFNRNLGTGEPIATGTRMKTADQEVFHDKLHHSTIVLPTVPTPK